MSPVAAPADQRFRRAHVKPSHLRSGCRAVVSPFARYALISALVGYGLYRAAGVAARARVLQIDRIAIRGNERLAEGEILALLGGLRGQSLVWADLDEWRR